MVESFVLREGTEYGEKDFSLDQKLAHVVRQLERGEAQIVFDPGSETIDIVVVSKARWELDSPTRTMLTTWTACA